jgi:hypothetical protein
MNTILNTIHKLARIGEIKEGKLISKHASFTGELRRMLAVMAALIATAFVVLEAS